MLIKTIQFSLPVFFLYTIAAYLIINSYNLGKPEISGFVYAGLLALLNIFLTAFFLEKNLKKMGKEFVKVFFRSTLIRLAIILMIFFTILVKMSLNHFVFGVGFLILYFLSQMIEIYILHTNKHMGK